MKKIQNIIDFMTKMLNIPNIKVYYGVMNYYFNNKIVIKRGSYKKCLFMALYELRHYYQEYYIKYNDNKISRLIRYEMSNYNNLDYESLYIEMDAYYFSYYVFKNILQIDYAYNIKIIEMIKKYELSFEFSLEGICKK